MVQPASQTVIQPGSVQPGAEPMNQSMLQPIVPPTGQPYLQPPAKPYAQPYYQPYAQPYGVLMASRLRSPIPSARRPAIATGCCRDLLSAPM